MNKKKFKYLLIYIILWLLVIAIGSSYFFIVFYKLNLLIFTPIWIYSFNLIMTITIFMQVRNVKAKLSWLVMSVILPIVGNILFILFGQRYSKRTSLENYHKRDNFKYEIMEQAKEKKLAHFSNISNRGVYKGDFTFTTNGNDAFESLFNDMKNAKKFIHLHFYIVKPGEIFDKFRDILIQKVKEGVEIRFIIDDFGQWAMPWFSTKELQKLGIQIVRFGKVHFPFIGSENGFRTHRKFAIIDGEVVHTGGFNIADEYCGLNKKYGNWLDYHVKITGKAVRSYTLLFIGDWNEMKQEKLSFNKYLKEKNTGKDFSIMMEDSPETTTSLIRDTFVSLISNAKKTISIATPYLLLSDEIKHALIYAANSGIKIEIFVPGKKDKFLTWYATKIQCQELLNKNINIYSTNNMFLHSKLAIFDNKIAYFGTANLDIRSMYSQFEIMNLVYGNASKEVNKIFKEYKNKSTLQNNRLIVKNKVMNSWLKFYITLFSSLI